MGLKLKIAPIAGELVISDITLDSSLTGLAYGTEYCNNHVIIGQDTIYSVGFDGDDASLRDSYSIGFVDQFGPKASHSFNNIFYAASDNSVYSFYINSTTGSITKWEESDLNITSGKPISMDSTADKLVILNNVGGSNYYLYSYDVDSSGALTEDGSLFLGPVYMPSIIGQEGEANIYVHVKGDGVISSYSINAGSITTNDSSTLLETGFDYSFLASTQTELIGAVEDTSILHKWDINSGGIISNPQTTSAGNPFGPIQISPVSDYIVTTRTNNYGFNIYNRSDLSLLLEKEDTNWNYGGFGEIIWIDSNGLKFLNNKQNKITNFTIDQSIGGSLGSVLSIVPSVETYTGVADFNVDQIKILEGDSDDFGTEYKVYRWKMWLDKDTGWANTLFQLPSSTSIDLRVLLIDSSIVFGTGVAATTFSISGLDNQILDCVAYTGYSPTYIENFEVNGSIISASEGYISSGYSGSTIVAIGAGITQWNGDSITNLTDAAVWDWSVETSTGTLLHSYIGYPAGDTLGAWEDQTGAMDVILNSVTSTRDIVGVNPGQGGQTGSVLLIAAATPPPPPVPGAPTLYRPLDTSLLGTVDPSLAWLSVSGADTYWVQVDDDPGFGSLLYDVSGISSLYYDVSSLDNSTAYYWRASATNVSGTGDWSTEWEFYTPQVEPSAMLYIVTDALAQPFDPVFTVSSGTLEWDMADGSIINANSFSHTYTTGGNKVIEVNAGTASGPEAITAVNIQNDDLQGELDFSSLTNLGGDFYVDGFSNGGLTYVKFPTSSQAFTNFYLTNTGFTGVLDVSGLTGLGGVMRIYSLSNMTGILWPPSSNDFTIIDFSYNGLTGSMDMSGVSGFRDIYGSGNFSLTEVILPTSSRIVEQFQFDNCDLTGTLDVSGLTGLSNDFIVSYNYNLTNILFPDSSQGFDNITAVWCDLTGTLDLTPLTLESDLGSGAIIELQYNSNLTEVLFPSTSGTVQWIDVAHCNITGTMDVSGLTNLYSRVLVEDNPNLQSVLFPSTLTEGLNFLATDSSLNQDTVDEIFALNNAWYTSNTPGGSTTLTIYTDGGGNAPPTDGSANVDLQNLITIFDGAGATFDWLINDI